MGFLLCFLCGIFFVGRSDPPQKPEVTQAFWEVRTAYEARRHEKGLEIIRDREEFVRIWEGELHSASIPLPPVDFGREMVLVYFMGGRASGGYSVGVREVRVTSEGLQLTVSELVPGRNCLVTMKPTSPVSVVITARFDGKVFTKVEEYIHTCDHD